MSAELSVSHLVKHFTRVPHAAVDDVSFSMQAGEILALLGPSGCGKTTTLRMVAGLEHPTGGTISIDGTVVNDPEHGVFVPPQERHLGMVFQSYAVWPHMTVRQNVAYPLVARKTKRSTVKQRVEEVIELVGLSEFVDRPVVALSGGQMQRVALARSLSYSPRLLLLDEPLSNLDAKLRIRLRDDLRKIIKEAGVTALYVTHDQAEAVVIGDRIGVMRNGVLVQIDEPRNLYNRPADPFVANFTGAETMLDAMIRHTGTGAELVLVGSDTGVMPITDRSLIDAEHVKVSLRPENVLLNASRTGADDLLTFEGTIAGARYLGTQTIYQVTVFGQLIDAVDPGTTPRFEVGETVAASFDKKNIYVFRG